MTGTVDLDELERLARAAREQVAEIAERDAGLRYCATCHARVYDPDADDDPHSYTVEECDRRLAEASAKRDKPRLPDPDTGHLCWSPEQHHVFIEGPVPEYAYEEWAARDRRTLLRILGEQEGRVLALVERVRALEAVVVAAREATDGKRRRDDEPGSMTRAVRKLVAALDIADPHHDDADDEAAQRATAGKWGAG